MRITYLKKGNEVEFKEILQSFFSIICLGIKKEISEMKISILIVTQSLYTVFPDQFSEHTTEQQFIKSRQVVQVAYLPPFS